MDVRFEAGEVEEVMGAQLQGGTGGEMQPY